MHHELGATTGPLVRRGAFALGAAFFLAAVSCGRRHDTSTDTTQPALATATATQVTPVFGSFAGDEGTDPRAEGRQEATRHVDGTAEWAYELDSLDLRRKVTIRIALHTPESTYVVLRALDDAPPAPGNYGVMLPATGLSHHDPRLFRADIHTMEVGHRRDYMLGMMKRDTVIIDAPTDGTADSTLRGRIRLRGSRYADAKPGQVIRDYVMHDVFGTFVAPQSSAAGPSVVVTPEMQERVLRRALDGFMMTNLGALNGDGAADSTKTSPLARRFLEGRWSAAAVIDSVMANGRTFHVRLRGRFAPTICEIDSKNTEIVCRYGQAS